MGNVQNELLLKDGGFSIEVTGVRLTVLCQK